MKYFITMRCIDRSPKENYIHTTMKSLIASGLFNSKLSFEFHLFDGGSPSLDYLKQYKELKNLSIHTPKVETTKNEDWLRAVGYCEQIKCDYVIQLEDDILFCNKWLESINTYLKKHKKLIDDNPMVSFYTPYKEIERRTKKKIEYWDQSFQQFYGTQCILFKKDIALKAVNHIIKGIKDINNYSFKFRKKNHKPAGMIGACIDLWLQEWGVHEYPNKFFIASCPSFVQHIGETPNKHLHQSHFLGQKWSYGK